MNTYHFRFNNSRNTATILFWFFATLLTVSLTGIVLVVHSDPLFPGWLLLISIPLMLLAIYRLVMAASKRQSEENISLNKEGFTSSSFGTALFAEIRSIRVPARQISLLGGKQYDFYKHSEADTPNLIISITMGDGKTFNWILGEWGGLYNSKEDFSVFYNFLTALTDQLYQLHHANEPFYSYLKILDENGTWEKRG